jgi:hypothetical protein
MCMRTPNLYGRTREVTAMHAKEIIEGLLLVVIISSAAMLLPDFVRYMKIRST